MSDIETADALLTRAIQASRDHRFDEATQFLNDAFAADPASAAGHRSHLADILGRGADLQNITRLAPFRLNTLIHSGWLHSLVCARPVDAVGRPIPWFTYAAIDFLEPKIQPDWSVLEWGSGNSTLWWAARVRRMLSVEHDPEWHQITAAQAPANTRIELVKDLYRYGTFEAGNERFDAIIIDGLERNRCARQAARLAKASAIIIFDNSDRKSVRDGLAFLNDTGWKRLDFFGLLPAYLYRTCTSVFYRDDAFLTTGPLPCDIQTSLGPTCAQVLGE